MHFGLVKDKPDSAVAADSKRFAPKDLVSLRSAAVVCASALISFDIIHFKNNNCFSATNVGFDRYLSDHAI